MHTSPVTFSIKGVIFDMDGTLIASTEADYLAWKMLFSKYKRTLTYEEYQPLLGVKSAELIQSKLQLQGEELQEALIQKLLYFKEIIEMRGIDSVPYANAFLLKLKDHNLKIALATSSRRTKMEMVMREVGLLDFFDATVTGDEVSNGKPAPDIFFKAAERLHLQPNECIVIEDARTGVIAAKNASMKCVAITTTHSADQLRDADIIIDSFENLNFEELCHIMYQ